MSKPISEIHASVLEEAQNLAQAIKIASSRNEDVLVQKFQSEQTALLADYSAQAHAQIYNLQRFESDNVKARDGVLTRDEYVAFRMKEEAGHLTAEYINSLTPAQRKEAEKKLADIHEKVGKDFDEVQKHYPDANKNDDKININEVAAKEMEFLKEAFPEQLKNYNNDPNQQGVDALQQLLDVAREANKGLTL